jgi:hypothetical protein
MKAIGQAEIRRLELQGKKPKSVYKGSIEMIVCVQRIMSTDTACSQNGGALYVGILWGWVFEVEGPMLPGIKKSNVFVILKGTGTGGLFGYFLSISTSRVCII